MLPPCLRPLVQLLVAALLMLSGYAQAFPLQVANGDTLASLSQRLYGKVENEKLLVSANGLDSRGGIAIVPGMDLEVPALRYQRVVPGDTWPDLAQSLLGARRRAAVMAFANDSKPWLVPPVNAEILIPYNLRYVAAGGETLSGIAAQFLGNQKRAYMLQLYNKMEGVVLKRGQVLLIPLTDLALSAEGQRLAEEAGRREASQSQGAARSRQGWVRRQLPRLLAHMRAGRYLEAVASGVEFLAQDSLTLPQQRIIHRQLLEAYVALGASGRAAQACRAWLQVSPQARLSRKALSPKVLNACRAD